MPMTEHIPPRTPILVYTVMKAGTHLVSNYIALMLDSQTNIYDKQAMYRMVRHVHSANDISTVASTHPRFVWYGNAVLQHCKIITCIRNPIDRAISLYYFVELRKHRPRPLISYLQEQLGTVSREGLRMIAFSEEHPDCLPLTFEECTLAKERTILRIHNFLRRCLPLSDHLSPSDLADIVTKTDFKQMQAHERLHGYHVGTIQPFPFHRSGQVKQWRHHLSADAFHELYDMLPRKYIERYHGIMSWDY